MAFGGDVAKLLKEARKLDASKRQLLADKLNKIIEKDIDAEPLSEAMQAELDRRLEHMRKNPDEGISWEELKRQIRTRRRKRSQARK